MIMKPNESPTRYFVTYSEATWQNNPQAIRSAYFEII
jgi:hypothetical protein